MDCAMASTKVSRMPEPLVMFKKFGDSALEFELHVWIHDINERHKVRSALHQDLESRLRDAGITIAFPQRDIHIRNGDQTMSKKLSLTQRRDDTTRA
jgi:small-conductance mechanosensitive channel